ncbi:MAG TPA: MFS transporter [Ktedonobacteraceae bacterium]|nr:MFS transporter [Ktedonobacteraceae bacterium]
MRNSNPCLRAETNEPSLYADQPGKRGPIALFSLRRSSRWSIVLALGMTTIVSYGTTQYLFGVLEVPLATAFSWSRTELSGAYALSLLIAGVLGVPIGYLVDRFGACLLMSVGSALAGCALIGLSQISTIFQFYVFWSGGLGTAMALILYPVTFTVVTSWFATERAKAFAVLTLIGGLASPIFIPLSGWLLPQVGWRTALFWYGLLHLVIAVPLHGWLVRRAPDQPHWVRETPDAPKTSSQEASSTTREALVNLRFWVLTGAYALALVGSAVVFAHQIAYLVSRGYGGLLAASVAGALGLASLPGRLFLNLLSARVLPQTVLAGTLLVQAGGLVVLILAPSVVWLWLYVLLYGAAFGVLSPLRAQVMADHFGKRAYGAITGFQGIPLALCQAAGPLVAGWLFDRLHHYDLAFWLCVGGFLLSALLIGCLPHPGQRQAGA